MKNFKKYITEMIHGPTPNVTDEYNLMHPIESDDEHEKKLRKLHHTLTSSHSDKVHEKYHKPLLDYTSAFGTYIKINQHLNGDHGIVPLSKDLTNQISDLNELVTSHEAPHDFHVYSGIKHDPSEGKEHKEPFKAHIKQFTSATIHPGVARSFSSRPKYDVFRHMIKVHIPKGSKHGMYIGKLSTHHGEHEFLLKPNVKLKIHHEPEIQKNYKIWHATIED